VKRKNENKSLKGDSTAFTCKQFMMWSYRLHTYYTRLSCKVVPIPYVYVMYSCHMCLWLTALLEYKLAISKSPVQLVHFHK